VGDKVYYAFIVVSHNSRSHEIVRSYFDRFLLNSYKNLAYKDWCRLQDLTKDQKGLTLERIEEIKTIRSNGKRKLFDFTHLNSLTL
jgi:hypothetical protein